VQNLLYLALELATAALSVAGSVLVCAAVGTSTLLPGVLAVAGMAMGLFAIPFAITISLASVLTFIAAPSLACFVLVLMQSSILSGRGVDRYLAILLPLRYNSLVTGIWARRVMAVLQVLAFSIELTPFLGWNSKDNATDNCMEPWDGTMSESYCLVRWLFENAVPMSYSVYFFLWMCSTPLLIMLVIYINIFVVACKQLQHTELMDQSRTTLQWESHSAKSLVMTVGILAPCWLPALAIYSITLFQSVQTKDRPKWAMNMAILSHASSVVNPIVHTYWNQDFHYTFHIIICLCILWQTDVLMSG
uniref:Adenosine receptor A2 n=1 Tax=Loxodonta africana TaxID=9785 RepID=G3TQW3_LOXAF